MSAGKWVAIDEVGSDNFATSIYENDFDGLLIARCNQNGSHPWQAPAIIRGLEKNKGLPVSLEEIVEVLSSNATMLEKQAPEIFPDVNEHGQVHFGRAVMESAAEELRALLSRLASMGSAK